MNVVGHSCHSLGEPVVVAWVPAQAVHGEVPVLTWLVPGRQHWYRVVAFPPCAFGAPRQRAVRQMLHTRRCTDFLAHIPFVAAASGGVQSTVPVGVAAHTHLDADGGVSRPGGSRAGRELRALDCALWSVAVRG